MPRHARDHGPDGYAARQQAGVAALIAIARQQAAAKDTVPFPCALTEGFPRHRGGGRMKAGLMIKVRRLIAALAVPLAVMGTALAAGSAHAAPTTVTAVTHEYNVPDSGNGGTWATDDFHRTVTVTLDSPQPASVPAGFLGYTATVSDSGTFTAVAGAFTPNQSVAGEKVANAVSGTMTGSASYVINAPAADVLGDTFPAALNAGGTPPSGPQSTSQWPVQAFTPATGVTVTLGNWSWTYTTPAGETWVDSSVNGDGNVVSDGNITGILAPPPVTAPVPHLSKGHAVLITGARENVYFVQSDAASCDHFTIVGPGKINGHQGWVRAHLGLNAAVYGGLEYNHGYTVFYTPVTGPADCSGGSTTPVPGSHWGYVYFVS